MDYFFDEMREQSQVKTRIVSKYFGAWANVFKRKEKIAYVDLFSGPGRYGDGAPSTPLLVLDIILKDQSLREKVQCLFNDGDATNIESLKAAISGLPNVELLHHLSIFWSDQVGSDFVKIFQGISLIPTLFFIDPWGYKGVSLELISSLLKNRGSDGIIFFNYNRINMAFANDAVRGHINGLFGLERAEKLRELLEKMSPEDREVSIIENMCEALKEVGGEYVLHFRFKGPHGSRTSHNLIFVSKHPLGYGIMKEIMAKESSEAAQGVSAFEYIPAKENQPLLFELSRPLDDLEPMLLNQFAGQSLTMIEIFDFHNVGRPYIKSNYKKALAKLEQKGKIEVSPPASKRRKIKGEITFADGVIVTFPKRP